MITTLALTKEADSRSRRAPSSVLRDRATCLRCGGLMVDDFCMDLLNGVRELKAVASRCVQCGEVVDPVILKNRMDRWAPRHHESVQQGRTE
jgi:hypothetical protein